mgnify:CR=1 FL=1
MEGREDCLFCLYLLRVYNASWIEIFLSQLINIIYFDGQNKIVTVMYIVISISKCKYYLTYISNMEQQYNQNTLLYDSVTHHTDLLSRHSACSQFHSCRSFSFLLVNFFPAGHFCQCFIYKLPTTLGNIIHIK